MTCKTCPPGAWRKNLPSRLNESIAIRPACKNCLPAMMKKMHAGIKAEIAARPGGKDCIPASMRKLPAGLGFLCTLGRAGQSSSRKLMYLHWRNFPCVEKIVALECNATIPFCHRESQRGAAIFYQRKKFSLGAGVLIERSLREKAHLLALKTDRLALR
jgi:hypothetical protein